MCFSLYHVLYGSSVLIFLYSFIFYSYCVHAYNLYLFVIYLFFLQEMMGLAYFLLDQSRKEAEYCMENAFNTYLVGVFLLIFSSLMFS